MDTEGTWTFVDGTTCTGPSSQGCVRDNGFVWWGSGQPDNRNRNGDEENCAATWTADANRLNLNDGPCSQEEPFVCNGMLK